MSTLLSLLVAEACDGRLSPADQRQLLTVALAAGTPASQRTEALSALARHPRLATDVALAVAGCDDVNALGAMATGPKRAGRVFSRLARNPHALPRDLMSLASRGRLADGDWKAVLPKLNVGALLIVCGDKSLPAKRRRQAARQAARMGSLLDGPGGVAMSSIIIKRMTPACAPVLLNHAKSLTLITLVARQYRLTGKQLARAERMLTRAITRMESRASDGAAVITDMYTILDCLQALMWADKPAVVARLRPLGTRAVLLGHRLAAESEMRDAGLDPAAFAADAEAARQADAAELGAILERYADATLAVAREALLLTAIHAGHLHGAQLETMVARWSDRLFYVDAWWVIDDLDCAAVAVRHNSDRVEVDRLLTSRAHPRRDAVALLQACVAADPHRVPEALVTSRYLRGADLVEHLPVGLLRASMELVGRKKRRAVSRHAATLAAGLDWVEVGTIEGDSDLTLPALLAGARALAGGH